MCMLEFPLVPSHCFIFVSDCSSSATLFLIFSLLLDSSFLFYFTNFLDLQWLFFPSNFPISLKTNLSFLSCTVPLPLFFCCFLAFPIRIYFTSFITLNIIFLKIILFNYLPGISSNSLLLDVITV